MKEVTVTGACYCLLLLVLSPLLPSKPWEKGSWRASSGRAAHSVCKPGLTWLPPSAHRLLQKGWERRERRKNTPGRQQRAAQVCPHRGIIMFRGITCKGGHGLVMPVCGFAISSAADNWMGKLFHLAVNLSSSLEMLLIITATVWSCLNCANRWAVRWRYLLLLIITYRSDHLPSVITNSHLDPKSFCMRMTACKALL